MHRHTGWRRLPRVNVGVHEGAERTGHSKVKGCGDRHFGGRQHGGRQRGRGKGGDAILAQLFQHFPCHDGDHRSRRGSVHRRQVIWATSSSGGDTAASNRGRRQIRLSRTSQSCAACGWRPHRRRDSFCGTSSRHAAKLDQGEERIRVLTATTLCA